MARMPAALVAALVIGITAQTAAAKKTESAQPHRSDEIAIGTASATAIGDSALATATASCPGGTKAAGGGFDAPSTPNVTGLVYESVKVGQHRWRASVQLFDPGGPSTLTLTTYVYCRAHFPATKASRETVPTTGELQIGPTATANCPSGSVAVAGGFSMPPPLIGPTVTDLYFDSLRTGPSGWEARVVTGPAGPSTVTSEAYCANAVAPPLEVRGTSAPVGLDGVSATAGATCPAGLSPAAGGFAQPDGMAISFFFVYASKRAGDGWEVSGLHAGTEPAIPLTAAAYCA